MMKYTIKDEKTIHLNQQIEILKKYSEDSKIMTEQFQGSILSTVSQADTKIQMMVKDTEKQVGRIARYIRTISL